MLNTIFVFVAAYIDSVFDASKEGNELVMEVKVNGKMSYQELLDITGEVK